MGVMFASNDLKQCYTGTNSVRDRNSTILSTRRGLDGASYVSTVVGIITVIYQPCFPQSLLFYDCKRSIISFPSCQSLEPTALVA